MPYLKEFITIIISSFTFIYILSILSFRPIYRNILYYPTPNGENFLGQIGSYVASISFFIFGKVAYILIIPLFIILFGLVFEKKKLLIYARHILFLALIISGFIGIFSQSFDGGLIGGITGILFKTLFGFVGTFLILIILSLFLLSYIFPKIGNSILNPNIIFKTIISKIIYPYNNQNNASKNKEKNNESNNKVIEIKEYYLNKENENNNNLNTNNLNMNHTNIMKESSEYKEYKEKKYNNNESNDIEYALIDYEYGGAIFEDSQDIKIISNSGKKIEEIEKDEEEKVKIIKYTLADDNKNDNEDNVQISKNEDMEVLNYQEKEIEEENISEKDISVSQNGIQYTDFKFPDISLLKDATREQPQDEKSEKLAIGQRLIEVLKEFNIDATLENIVSGPVITRYEITPPKGLKLNKIVSLEDNISLGLASHEKIRIEAPVPGKKVVGIEVPNKHRELITLKEMLTDNEFKPDAMAIPFALGKDITGKSYYTDISKIPHLLIAGSTGSGKSVCLNSLITTILYTKKPDEVKLILVDPKRVELKLYDGIPHLITPVIKEIGDAINMLNWAVSHMEERYKILESCNVRNIKTYNLINKEKMPYILIIIDEFADFIIVGKKEIEDPIIRLAAMARAVGIHLVLATQRPSADIITNLIKANFPGRIAFKVATKLESRIILDVNGAEKLLGKGDMLYASPNSLSIKRLQSPMISDEEVNSVTEFYRKNYQPQYWDIIENEEMEEAVDPTDEPLFNDAVNIVLRDKKASASYLQRRLKIGYNRAARIIEMMEEMGIISPPYAGKREILIDSWNNI